MIHISDSRIKNIIKYIGKSPSGINIYIFSFKFNPFKLYQGVIAQELITSEKFSDCVIIGKNNFYSVDYSKIDVEFKETKL